MTKNKSISPLRQRMLEDMRMRKLSPATQAHYLRAVERLAKYLGESSRYRRRGGLASLSACIWWKPGMTSSMLNATITGLKFLFEVTLGEPGRLAKMSTVREPRKLPVILSPEEVTRVLESAPNLKARAALSVAYATGLRPAEVVALKLGDIDSDRMVIRVEQGKGQKDRYAMLSPTLLHLLRHWYREGKARGKMLPGGWLFPGPQPRQPAHPAPAQSAIPSRGRRSRPRQEGIAAIPSTCVRDPLAGTKNRHPRDPGVVGPQEA